MAKKQSPAKKAPESLPARQGAPGGPAAEGAQGAASSVPLAELVDRVAQLRTQGLLPAARQVLDRLLKSHPSVPALRREQVLLFLASEQFAEAEAALELEARRSPQNRWAWMTLGFARLNTGNRKGEAEALAQGLKLKAEEAPARRLFELQRDAKDFAGALETVRMLRGLRDTPELEVAECQLLSMAGKKEEALAGCERLMDRVPAPAGAVEHWCMLHMERNDPEAVLAGIRPRISAGREEAALHVAMSRACQRMERNAEAIEHLQKALAIDPSRKQWWYDLAISQRQMGDIPGSQVSLEHALQSDPLNPTTLRVFGVEHKHAYGDDAFKRIDVALAAMERFPVERQVELHYAAAKAYEDVGELDAAFEHYAVGGGKQTRLTPYRHSAVKGLLSTMRHKMVPAVYEGISAPRCQSDMPVFVLGMPRSGTTLVEQVIASHPKAFGAGELKLLHRVLDGISVNGTTIRTNDDPGVIPTYIPGVDLNCTTLQFDERGERYVQAIRALAKAAGRGDVLRVVDKMPGNYFWTGLVPFVLPRAKIIHTRRHPMDCCLSNYRIFFPDGMPWSYDLRNLGKCYRAYHDHMLHWESNLPPGTMLSVRYEDTVADLETMARRIIAHVGLDWNEACLRFYETERPVKTASLGQVRQPIYNTSVGRWRKYEKYLKPLMAEIGPLVEAYEAELAQPRAAAQA